MNFHWPTPYANISSINRNSINIISVKNSDNIQKEFLIYSEQFISAANILASHTLSKHDNRIRDFWFFSIVYLYRQSLELLIKSIAFHYIEDKNKRKNFIKEVHHNLIKGFETIKYHLESNGPYTWTNELHWLQNYLKDISSVDEQSDMFRYPFNTRTVHFFTGQTYVNLLALAQNMETAYCILVNILNPNTYSINVQYEHKLLIDRGPLNEQSIIWANQRGNDLNFYPYIEGYIDSANFLYERIIKDNPIKEHLFLPMCYLYRNGIELSLKRILIEDSSLPYKEALQEVNRSKHKILRIWNKIKEDLKSYSQESENDQTLLDVENYIIQLNNVDSDSSTFRYPINKQLDLHFSKPKRFDIDNVSSFFNELFNFLDGVDSMIKDVKAIEAEFLSQYIDDYY